MLSKKPIHDKLSQLIKLRDSQIKSEAWSLF